MFGYQDDKFVIYKFLVLKIIFTTCKFQNKSPTYQGFKAYLNINKEIEYRVAKRKGKLAHYHKWGFDLLNYDLICKLRKFYYVISMFMLLNSYFVFVVVFWSRSLIC